MLGLGADTDRELFKQALGSLLHLRQAGAGLAELSEPRPVRLASGPSDVVLYCIPSLAAPSTPLQFARLATSARARFSVWSMANVGYRVDERLPSGVDEIIEPHVRALLSPEFAGAPCVVLGYSAGGWVARDVVRRLEQLGAAPRGLVILDADPPQRLGDDDDDYWTFIEIGADYYRTLPNPDVDAMVGDMTGMVANYDLYTAPEWTEGWSRVPIETPTYFVRALEGWLNLGREDVRVSRPERSWAHFCERLAILDVQTDHYTMIAQPTILAEIVEGIAAWLELEDPQG